MNAMRDDDIKTINNAMTNHIDERADINATSPRTFNEVLDRNTCNWNSECNAGCL